MDMISRTQLRSGILGALGVVCGSVLLFTTPALGDAPNVQQPVFFASPTAYSNYYSSFCAGKTPTVSPYPTRWPAAAGQGKTFQVWVDGSRVSHVDIKEQKRKTEIQTDLSALMQKVLAAEGIAANLSDDDKAKQIAACIAAHPIVEYSSILTLDRSTLTLTATNTPTSQVVANAAVTVAIATANVANQKAIDAAATAADKVRGEAAVKTAVVESNARAAGAKASADISGAATSAVPAASGAAASTAAASTTLGTTTVIVGPAEHLFLSIDLPVTNRKTLKYSSANGGTLQPSDTNPQFYIAFNTQAGDILDPPVKWTDWHRLAFKVLIQASSKPLDSLGAGVGYVFPQWGLAGKNLSSISVFAGRFWTKQDAIVKGVPEANYSYAQAWRFGITYNFTDMVSKLNL